MPGQYALPDTGKLGALRPHALRVVLAIEHVTGCEVHLVTDRSCMCDFAPDDPYLAGAVAVVLGVPVALDDYVWQVAERLERPPS